MNTTALSFLGFGAIVMTYAVVITVVDGEDPLWLLLDGGVLIGAFFIVLGRDDTQAHREPVARVVQAPPRPVPSWVAQDQARVPERLPVQRLHLSGVVAWWVTARITPPHPAPYRTPAPRVRPEEPPEPYTARAHPPARHRRTGGPR